MLRNRQLELIRAAANNGDADALAKLGDLYEDGQEVPQSDIKAAECFKEAAMKGHAGAQLAFGFMLFKGRGVPKNEVEALKYYKAAAEQELAPAQFVLGLRYQDGRGIPKDDIKATECFQKAAKQGYQPAKEMLQEKRKQLNSFVNEAKAEFAQQQKLIPPGLSDASGMQFNTVIRGKSISRIPYMENPPAEGGEIHYLTPEEFKHKFNCEYTEGIVIRNSQYKIATANDFKGTRAKAAYDRLINPLETLVICKMSDNIGYGLFTTQDIKMGTVLCIYA